MSGMETQIVDAAARVVLPSSFAESTVAVQRISENEYRIRKVSGDPDADAVFEEESMTVLSNRDRDRFLAILENPPPPNDCAEKPFYGARSKMADVRIEPFDAARHDRTGFACGKPTLDDFLHKFVSQYHKRRLGTTFVAIRADGSKNVVGYYSLAASAVRFDSIPAAIAKQLPRHPIPTVLVARLAVDERAQNEGIGKALLRGAFQRALSISSSVAVYAVEVDAIDEVQLRFTESSTSCGSWTIPCTCSFL